MGTFFIIIHLETLSLSTLQNHLNLLFVPPTPVSLSCMNKLCSSLQDQHVLVTTLPIKNLITFCLLDFLCVMLDRIILSVSWSYFVAEFLLIVCFYPQIL